MPPASFTEFIKQINCGLHYLGFMKTSTQCLGILQILVIENLMTGK